MKNQITYFYILKKYAYGICITTLLMTSFILRTRDLLGCGTLRWDEAMLAINIITRNYMELLKPMDWYQVAPFGYLWITKFIAQCTSYSDFGLRFLSWLSGVTLPCLLFIVTCKKFNQIIPSALISLAICINPYLMNYSVEMKPYIFDMLLCLPLLYFYLNFSADSLLHNKKVLTSTIIFFWSGALLFNAYFIAAATLLICIGAAVLYPKFNFQMFRLWIVLSAGSGISYLIVIKHHPYKQFMHAFWEKWFISLSSDYIYSLKNIYWRILSLFGNFFGSEHPEIILFGVIFSLIVLILFNVRLGVSLLLPMCLHITLALFAVYPLAERLSLIWIPHLLLLLITPLFYLKNKAIKILYSLFFIWVAFPWRYIPTMLQTPILKCTYNETLKKIPQGANFYLSESASFIHMVQTQRDPDKHPVRLIYSGKTPILSSRRTSQTFGILSDTNKTIAKEIHDAHFSLPLYVVLHAYSKTDIALLCNELSTHYVVSTIVNDAQITYCDDHKNTTASVLLKLDTTTTCKTE